MDKEAKKIYDLIRARKKAISHFAVAMKDADLKYLHDSASLYFPFTWNMKEAWYDYMQHSIDLYDTLKKEK